MHQTIYARLENFLLLALGFGIFISKPVIHISSGLLILLFAVKTIVDSDYRVSLWRSPATKVALGIFLLGVIGTALGSGSIDDTVWIARKSIYLLLIGPLLLAFTNSANRTSALSGLFLGFWLAFVLTAHENHWTWAGHHTHGATWLVDTWAVLCALLACFLVPLALNRSYSSKYRALFALTILAALFMLLTTGSRGPWLGTAIGITFYLVMRQRRLLLYLVVLSTIAYLPVKHVWPDQVNSLEARVLSIGNTKTDESNFVRLALWETGLAHISAQITSGNFIALTGQGRTGSTEALNEFYNSGFAEVAVINPGWLRDVNINDLHTMYLDSIVKNGLLWTAANLLLLGWLCFGGNKHRPQNYNRLANLDMSRTPILLAFLVIGITYSILPHYATLFLVYFLTLSRGMDKN
jgi:hypothetical protein